MKLSIVTLIIWGTWHFIGNDVSEKPEPHHE